MRITFITQWFDPEPGAFRGLPLAEWLARRGHEVSVVTGFPNYPGGHFYPGYRMKAWQREQRCGVGLIRLPLYPSHDRSGLRRLANYGSFAVSAATLGLALAPPADVAYVYHPPATVGLAALAWKWLRSTPFVFHIADMWPDTVAESGMVRSRPLQFAVGHLLGGWCRRLYEEAGAISVLSPGFKDLLVERGVDSTKIDVIYNWADESIFEPQPRNESLARDLGMAGMFNIVYAGNLGPFQCVDVAVRAAARLAHLPNLQLVLVGTGIDDSDLRRLASRVGATNVRFVYQRPQNQMGAISNLADVMLISLADLPFLRRTIPGKTQVALAMGKPVVVAGSGDLAHLVRGADAGVVCPPGDEDALTAAFLRLYQSGPTTLEAVGARARAFYLNELSLQRGAARTEALLARVAAA